ncbi:MAG: GIY-YIG nuclease family protein [Selenomonadaceae bacterium]|nr:GIY-YIG nuclease family protein [Selenomonadaceae bacterium]
MKVFGVVYLILNKLNGKMYVGQTVQSLKNRMARHLSGDQYIDRALKKYGLENFYYGVIKSCASKAEMDYWERFFIAALKTKSPIGYNFTDGGEGTVGIERTPEQRAKLSAALSGERNPRYGKKNSPEHQAKIVAANLGSKCTPETCRNISEALKGAVFPPSRCANISAAKRADSPFKNLIAELEQHKLSYTALAKLMDLEQSIISRKMRCCKRNFTERDKVKLEKIFGKPAEYLLEREEN